MASKGPHLSQRSDEGESMQLRHSDEMRVDPIKSPPQASNKSQTAIAFSPISSVDRRTAGAFPKKSAGKTKTLESQSLASAGLAFAHCFNPAVFGCFPAFVSSEDAAKVKIDVFKCGRAMVENS